ncbi:MAG: hypothetical protein ABSB40_02890 [Nitrososphaeria archaeon]|jgi:hypothetical protein
MSNDEINEIDARINELSSTEKDKNKVALMLKDEGYPPRDIMGKLHVSGHIFGKARGKEQKKEKVPLTLQTNADKIVLDASALATLEDLKKWAQENTHLTLKEVLIIGKGMVEMDVKRMAADQGLPLWDFIQKAINFHNSWYDSVVKLIKLGVLTFDGRLNTYTLNVQEVRE